MVWFRCSVQSQDIKKDKINWIDKVLVLILIIQKRIESSMQTVQVGGCTLCCYWSLISNEAVCWCWSCTVGNYQPIIAPYIITTHRSLAPDWSSPATRTNPALPLVGGNETKARPPPAAGPRWPQPGSCSSSLVWMEDGYHDPAPPLLRILPEQLVTVNVD